jgi:hypothetical protein
MKKNTNSLERSLLCCLGASVVSPPFSIGALLSLTLSIRELCVEELQYKHVADISSLEKFQYSLRSIILFANVDVPRHILVVDTSILAKSNMDRREYIFQYSGNSALSQSENSKNILVSCSSEHRATIVVS